MSKQGQLKARRHSHSHHTATSNSLHPLISSDPVPLPGGALHHLVEMTLPATHRSDKMEVLPDACVCFRVAIRMLIYCLSNLDSHGDRLPPVAIVTATTVSLIQSFSVGLSYLHAPLASSCPAWGLSPRTSIPSCAPYSHFVISHRTLLVSHLART